ncbi:hypothetical protein O181_009462 [Austropuccinia psidii MF-1]|uniref:Major facilitator superfamily (MFS) profile domain-containing protein n=1 Tax=Austropuccinia psidii MF-1 TaxID=1389203 RepID=A0A9Q3BQU6_9BASI|nr:hypothetical protein [Austropuccinia psidii MF-1]
MSTLEIYDPQHPNHQVTRQELLKKLDWNVLPALSLLWLACFIDRTNIGNAKVGGMNTSLGLHGNQFNIGLAVFYITYIFSELPSNYILKRLGGKLWLPFLVASWGIITIMSGFMTNFASLIIIRLLLGLFEGGLLPGMVVYLSTMYKRHELQLRVGIFFAFASLSGAFGGLLAYAIEQMDGVSGKKGWQWLFYLEGIATVFIAIFAWCCLPQNLETASFLTPSQRDFAVNRLKFSSTSSKPNVRFSPMVQSDSSNQDFVNPISVVYESQDENSNGKIEKAETLVENSKMNSENVSISENFEMIEVIRGFKEPQVWISGLGYMALCVGLYSYSLFLPSIISGMGYRGSQAQLFSSFPYLPASVLVVVIAFLADKWQVRGPIVICLLPLTIVGYVLAITAETNKVRYIAVFFMSAGIYPSIPSILCILPNNVSGLTKRSVTTALQLMIANCAGFIGTFIYTSEQAPTYRRGHSIALGFTCLAWIMIGLNSIYCLFENHARSRGKRDMNITEYLKLVSDGKTKAPIGDRAPDFKFTI